MLKHAAAAAARHLARTWVQAAIATGGLALGLWAALTVALVIHSEYTFDRFVPDHERIYVIVPAFGPPGLAPQYVPITMPDFAADLSARTTAIEASTRVFEDSVRVTLGTRTAREQVHFADPGFTALLPLRSLAGDASAALATADGLVLSRSAARRWFNMDAPIGRVLHLNDLPLTVRAVVEDPPDNATHAERHFIASGLSSGAPPNRPRAGSRDFGGALLAGFTYLRLRPGARAADLDPLLPGLVPRRDAGPPMLRLELVRLDHLHTHEGLNPGLDSRARVFVLLGFVIMAVATVNFVNLQTARGAGRAREVAIRRVAGATRAALVVQFMGEAIAFALLAALLALAMTELLLPSVNAALASGATLGYTGDREFVWLVLGGALAVGVVAGAWPALILSGLRPLRVLRTGARGRRESLARQSMVALQFAALIALVIGAGVALRQRDYALHDALRFDTDQVLVVATSNNEAFAQQLRTLPGVRTATRTGLAFLGSTGLNGVRGISVSTAQGKDGQPVSINTVGTEFDVFDFFGVQPLAGRLPRVGATAPPIPIDYAVVNESAARKFELGLPSEAVGKPLPISPPGNPGTPEAPTQTRVLAVVPDFSLESVAKPVPPTVYLQANPEASPLLLMVLRLDGRQIPATLAAIDALWKRTGGDELRLNRSFLDDMLQRHYIGVLRQSQAFALGAGLAVVLSCIGLYGLTEANAQRRTREIALRKALGAQTRAVLRLLLWQFVRPVLWGGVVAWIAAAWLMQRWLEGFAYHAALPLWLFPVAAIAGLTIAAATVLGHALAVARTRPAVALRVD